MSSWGAAPVVDEVPDELDGTEDDHRPRSR